MDGGGNYFNVFVDDELVRVLETVEGFEVYELCPEQGPVLDLNSFLSLSLPW